MQKISIIIPTKNRPIDLSRALNSIVSQSYLPYEIIIVDQSESDDAGRLAESIIKKVPEIKLKYIHDPNIRGASSARNVAMDIASGDLVMFLDDDVILHKDYTKNVVGIFARHHEVAGVGGYIINGNSEGWLIQLTRRIFQLGEFRDERDDFQSGRYNCMYTRILSGGNSTFRRNILKNYRFTDELTGYSLSEDKDLSYRISRHYKLLLTKKALLIHNCSPVSRENEEVIAYKQVVNTYWFYKKNIPKTLINKIHYYWLNVGIFIRACTRLYRIRYFRGCLKGFYDIIGRRITWE